jgi:hypothetical protein
MLFPVQRVVYPRSDDLLDEILGVNEAARLKPALQLTWGLLPWIACAPRVVEFAMVLVARLFPVRMLKGEE